MRHLVLLSLLAACSGKGPSDKSHDQGDSGDDPPSTGLPAVGTVWGASPGDGFGTALATSDDDVYIGAPYVDGGLVHRLDVIELGDGVGSPTARFGLHLAYHPDSHLLVGDPTHRTGSGAIADRDGTVIDMGGPTEALGVAVAFREDGSWLAATATGVVDANGEVMSTPGRPSSLAAMGDTVAVGMAHGDIRLALSTGETLARDVLGDESGWSLLAADVDGDGAQEWVLGAPGANRVEIWSADLSTLEASLVAPEGALRFGASLAALDLDEDGAAELLVGAPMTGAEVEGAAHGYAGGSLVHTTVGSTERGQLGFAVALLPGLAVMGAPGGQDAPGAVVIAEW